MYQVRTYPWPLGLQPPLTQVQCMTLQTSPPQHTHQSQTPGNKQSEQSAIIIIGCLFYKPNIFLCLPEPAFQNLLRSPGIDSQPDGLVRQPYLTFLPARQHRPAEWIPWNRFLGSLNVYKYGLRSQLAISEPPPPPHTHTHTILVQGQVDRGLSDCCISFWPKYLWMPACPLLRDTL